MVFPQIVSATRAILGKQMTLHTLKNASLSNGMCRYHTMVLKEVLQIAERQNKQPPGLQGKPVSEKIKKKIVLSWSESYLFIVVFWLLFLFLVFFNLAPPPPPKKKKKNHDMAVGNSLTTHTCFWWSSCLLLNRQHRFLFYFFCSYRFPSSILSTRRAVGTKQELFNGSKREVQSEYQCSWDCVVWYSTPHPTTLSSLVWVWCHLFQV